MNTKDIPKHIVGRKVAVIVSPGYGSSWSANISDLHDRAVLCLHEDLVLCVQTKNWDRMYELLKTVCTTNMSADYDTFEELTIEWVPVGHAFIIQEYDGVETLTLLHDFPWIIP